MLIGAQKMPDRQRPRLYWCPTGAFAFTPLHAAGIYKGRNRECCSDYVVSSYAPTLTALLRAQQHTDVYTVPEMRLVTVTAEQALDTALPTLRYVAQETQQISEIAATVGMSLAQARAKGDVLASLSSTTVVHFACHGVQNDKEPHESHFCLGDGNLTISELMDADLGDAFFAFLSACETAKGDHDYADEAVHLAASMLFAGFKSVIATMW
jgi:CHAT domain-containing protein